MPKFLTQKQKEMQPSRHKGKDYYEYLQKNMPDNRGNQGKTHELAFVLSGVLLGVLAGYHKIAQIQRFMKNRVEEINECLGTTGLRYISDAQLRRVLRGVDWQKYNDINMRFMGKRIEEIGEAEWVAVDGKDLRGSIGKDDGSGKGKRSEVTVNAVSHLERDTVAQAFYEGDKESEITVVRELLVESGLSSKNVTLDALHCNPLTTSVINVDYGHYIMQVKDNQAELLEDLQQVPRFMPVLAQCKSVDKGHGRLEKRGAVFYDLREECFDPRWKNSGIKTLVLMERDILKIKKGIQSIEKSIYITNISPLEVGSCFSCQNIFDAIRGHWRVEADNNIRDVTFKEDDSKTQRGGQTRTMASIRTMAINFMRRSKVTNFAELSQKIRDIPQYLGNFLNDVGLNGT